MVKIKQHKEHHEVSQNLSKSLETTKNTTKSAYKHLNSIAVYNSSAKNITKSYSHAFYQISPIIFPANLRVSFNVELSHCRKFHNNSTMRKVMLLEGTVVLSESGSGVKFFFLSFSLLNVNAQLANLNISYK